MSELVQAVAVRRGASHEDTVRAAAIASVRAYLTDPDGPAWRAWLAGPFVKTVRRAREGEFNQLAAHAATQVDIGSAAALAWPPTPNDNLPPGVAKLQVSGTDFPRQGWPPFGSAGPVLVINDDLEMTTGKTAAQAAHALFVVILGMDSGTRQAWEHTGCPLNITSHPSGEFARAALHADVHIADAGRTEVAPGSLTVVAFTDHGRGLLFA